MTNHYLRLRTKLDLLKGELVYLRKAAWDEFKHPRGEHSRFEQAFDATRMVEDRRVVSQLRLQGAATPCPFRLPRRYKRFKESQILGM